MIKESLVQQFNDVLQCNFVILS